LGGNHLHGRQTLFAVTFVRLETAKK